MSEWISVNTPPKKDGMYICLYIEDRYLTAFLEGKLIPAVDDIFGCTFEYGKFTEIDFSGGDRKVLVNFWMHLPEPPKECMR